MSGPEAKIQARILRELKKRNIYAIKVIIANKNGVPDIICCVDGKFVGIEVKTPRGRVSAVQEFHIRLINAAGGEAFVARSWEDVLEKLTKK